MRAKGSSPWTTGVRRTSASSGVRSPTTCCSWRCASGSSSGYEGLDRPHPAGPRAGHTAADPAAARARRRGRGHVTRLRPDGGAAGVARHRRRGARAARWALAAREGTVAVLETPRAAGLGEGPGVRRRPHARLARTDRDRPPPRDPERDDVRLRVRLAPAPARLPRRHTRGRPGRDSTGTARALRRRAREARPLRGAEGGVLPRGLRAGPERARPVDDRSRADARRRTHASGRLALPPPLEPALPAGARAARARRRHPCDRRPAYSGPARIRARTRAALRPRARSCGRRAEPDRRLRP